MSDITADPVVTADPTPINPIKVDVASMDDGELHAACDAALVADVPPEFVEIFARWKERLAMYDSIAAKAVKYDAIIEALKP